jgi:hypothetical protein
MIIEYKIEFDNEGVSVTQRVGLSGSASQTSTASAQPDEAELEESYARSMAKVKTIRVRSAGRTPSWPVVSGPTVLLCSPAAGDGDGEGGGPYPEGGTGQS